MREQPLQMLLTAEVLTLRCVSGELQHATVVCDEGWPMDDEIRAIVEAERERNHVAIRKRDNRLRRARAQAERLAAELANIDPAVREVWLFGSVARDSPGQEQFDIVELENVSARFREMVRRTGVRLYGSDG